MALNHNHNRCYDVCQKSDLVDLNLVISIWTGSIVPIIAVFIAAWFLRGLEARKIIRREKARVYTRFLWALDDVTDAVNDYQTVLSLKTKPNDPQDVFSSLQTISSLTSVLRDSDGASAIATSLTQLLKVDGTDKEKVNAAFAEIYLSTIARLITMLGHVLTRASIWFSRYGEEIENFEITESLGEQLEKVTDLFLERRDIFVNSLLQQLTGAKDVGLGEVGVWTKTWNEAVEKLREELREDLKGEL